MKYPQPEKPAAECGRSPCGERGLKSWSWLSLPVVVSSLPVRGAWIEIINREIANRVDTSLPVRGAWIEIYLSTFPVMDEAVAPRAGSVD